MRRIRFIFFAIYFFVLLGHSTFLSYNQFSLSLKDILQTIFTIVSFIPFAAYIFKKNVPFKFFWKLFIAAYFIWELGNYIFITGFQDDVSFLTSMSVLIILLPKYYCLFSYGFPNVKIKINKRFIQPNTPGVTFLSVTFIIACIMALYGTINPSRGVFQFLQASVDSGIGQRAAAITFYPSLRIIFSIFIPILCFIAGIFMFKLENWARKLAIAICLFSIPVNIYGVGFLYNENFKAQIIFEKQEILEKYQGVERARRMEFLNNGIAKVRKTHMPFTIIGFAAIILLCNSGIVYYLTRPKVKQQFK